MSGINGGGLLSPSGTMRSKRSIGDTGTFAHLEEEDYETGIQVIDENKEFTPNLSLFLSANNLLTAGFSYHLVAVFGSQSTGKSTLLNHRFGTSFSVMDEKARKQTTKGIWMSRAEGEDGMGSNILVMDVEGTDGRERGEDQDFERKSALFALATSEVMIVNIWEHQVGLYQGANMGLLKTVFEVNLQLFQKNQTTSQRSLLFFVIRDHVGHTPIESLADLLLADLHRIWSSLSKPAGLEESSIHDFFDFEFAALPHKILQAQQFVDETKKLRQRFREVEDEEQILAASKGGNGVSKGPLGGTSPVFLPAYHRRIPADGFPMYAEGIWSQIITNKDLDLPTQQELLAQYRCDEISAICMARFDSQVYPFEEQARSSKSVLADLGPAIRKARKECLDEFEESAGRYHKAVFNRKKEELITKVDSRLKALVVIQLTELHRRAVKDFEEEVSQALKLGKASSTSYDFRSIVETARENVLNVFKTESQELVLPAEDNSSWAGYEQEELETLETDIDLVAGRMRIEEMQRLVSRLERTLKTKLGEGVQKEFAKMGATGGKQVWDGVWNCYQEDVKDAAQQFEKSAKGFDAGEQEVKLGVWQLKRRGWAVLKGRIDEEVSDGNLQMKLRDHFEDLFRHDENGVPRVWKPSDDIESHYTKAREATLQYIPLLSTFKLSSTNAAPDLSSFLGATPKDATDEDIGDAGVFPAPDEFDIISEGKQLELTSRFKRVADALYVEAKRSTISSEAQIPMFMYALLLALGWNELWAVIRNPLYFMFLLLVGVAAYVVYTLNMLGPMLRVGNAMFNQSVEIAREKVREFADGGAPRATGRSRDADEISLQTLDEDGRRLTKRSTGSSTKSGEKEDW